MRAPLRTLALFALALLLVGGAAAQEGMSLEDLIALNLDSKGGEEALRAVDSIRVQGTMVMGGGQMTAPFTWEWKSPDMMRTEFTIQGMTAVQAYDGETAWAIMPFTGKTDAEKLPEEQADGLRRQADFLGPFVDSEEKGYTLELLGEEEIDGTPAYKVQVTNDKGDVTYLFLDKDYGLEIQSISKRTVQGQEFEATTAIGDYKEVGDLMIAHSFDVQAAGSPMGGQTMTFQSIELNPELSDDRFEMPEAEAAPAAGAEGGGGR